MANDYYKSLGVSRNADSKEIKSAYRKLARKYHPDVNPGDKAAEAKFKEVSEAYGVLGDEEKRRLYDQYGHNWEAVQNGGGPNPGGGRVDFDFGSDFGSFFDFFTGGAGGGRVKFEDIDRGQPKNVEQTLTLSLEEIDSGTTRTLTFQTMDAQRTKGGVTTIPTTKKVEVRIPPGIEDGMKLRVPGKGAAGINGQAGDLFVTVKWAKHARYRPTGEKQDLEVLVEVPFSCAALGGDVKIETLRGPKSLSIPPGSQGGQVFRLAGQGISRRIGGRSDLMAKVAIVVPKILSPAQRKLIEQLRDLEK